jgi:hypothetical protein
VETAAAVVETETVTETELLSAGIVAGVMVHVLCDGAPTQVRLTLLGKGPPDEVNVNG